MCEWAAAAAEADYLVLNRGMHYTPEALVGQQLRQTFDRVRQMHEIRSRSREVTGSSQQAVGELSHAGESRTSNRIVYRSTHASMPSCHVLALDDSLPPSRLIAC